MRRLALAAALASFLVLLCGSDPAPIIVEFGPTSVIDPERRWAIEAAEVKVWTPRKLVVEPGGELRLWLFKAPVGSYEVVCDIEMRWPEEYYGKDATLDLYAFITTSDGSGSTLHQKDEGTFNAPPVRFTGPQRVDFRFSLTESELDTTPALVVQIAPDSDRSEKGYESKRMTFRSCQFVITPR